MNSAQIAEAVYEEERHDHFPSILRGFGAAAVVAALSTFLLRGWTGSNDLFKYALLLASTVCLAGVAMVIVQTLRESKGPRLLLLLALTAVPVNFAVLGAFGFYACNFTQGMSYPDYFTWSIASPSLAAITVAVSVLLLLPVVAIGFRTLARAVSLPLGAFYIAANLALLIPVRNAGVIAFLVLVLLAIALVFVVPALHGKSGAKTAEARFAIMLQLLPLGIMLGRSLWLYSVDEVVLFAATGFAWFTLRQLAGMAPRSAGFINFVSLAPTFMAGWLLADLLRPVGLGHSAAMLAGAVLSAALAYELSERSETNRNTYRTLALLTVVCGAFAAVATSDGVLLSLVTTMLGIGLVFASFRIEQTSLLIGGSLVTVFSVANIGLQAFMFFSIGSWITLLLVGVVAIATGSFVDAHGESIRSQLRDRRERFEGWGF